MYIKYNPIILQFQSRQTMVIAVRTMVGGRGCLGLDRNFLIGVMTYIGRYVYPNPYCLLKIYA